MRRTDRFFNKNKHRIYRCDIQLRQRWRGTILTEISDVVGLPNHKIIVLLMAGLLLQWKRYGQRAESDGRGIMIYNLITDFTGT
jgi:hypothetical protein